MKITRLVLIRHGTTDWNKKRRYCGCRDIGLSKQGKIQAERLRQNLRDINFHKVYSSNKKRAVQTARITFKDFKIIKLKGIQELNFGAFEGLSHKEIMKEYPQIYRRWLDNPFKNTIPKAEDLNSFKTRVCAAFKKIVSGNYGKTIGIVCHGGTISIFIASILKSRDFWRHIPKSASISIVEFRRGKPRLTLFNKT
jgi:alpha-ribazole phosphatase